MVPTPIDCVVQNKKSQNLYPYLPVLYGLLAARALLAVNKVLSHGQDHLDSVSVGGQLGLEGLVLLVLGADVSRILQNKLHLKMRKIRCN